MKKPLFFALLTVLFCALFAVSLAACSDDKAPEPAPNAPNPESPGQDNGNPDNPETPDTNITYTITAKYPDGNPVVGIKFALADGNEEHNASAVTDAEGKETFSLPPKTYSVKLADYGTVDRSAFSFDDNKYSVTPQAPSVTVEFDRITPPPITPPSITTNTVEAEETSTEKFAAPYDASFAFLPQNAELAKKSDVYTYNGKTVLVAIAGETFIPKGTGKSLAALAEENSEEFIFDTGENKKNDYSKFIAAYAENCNENGLHVLTDEMKTLLDLYAAAKGLDPLFACGVYTEDNPDLTTGEGSESSPYAIAAGTYSVKIAAGRTLYFSAEKLLMITSRDDKVTITYEEEEYTAGDIEFDCDAGGTFAVTVTDGSEATITFTAVEIKVKEGYTDSQDPEKISPADIVGEYRVPIALTSYVIEIKTVEEITLVVRLKTENVQIAFVSIGFLNDNNPDPLTSPGERTLTIEAGDTYQISISKLNDSDRDDLFARFSIE